MIDSGAARSVCPESHARHVPLTDRKENVQLVGANGGVIETFGDKDVGYTLQDGRNFAVQYTVAKVRRPVVSVSQAVNNGTSWVFSPAGSFMVRGAVTLDAPGKVELIREGDLYFVDVEGFAAAAAGPEVKEVMPVHPAVAVEAPAVGIPGVPVAPLDPAAIQAAGAAAVQAEREPERAAKSRKIPALPTLAEQQAHALTHLPGRSWCSVCVQAKAIDDRHLRPEAEMFSLEEVNSFVGMPWDLKEKVYGVPRPPLLLAAPEALRGVVGLPEGSEVVPAVEGDAQSSRVLYITKALTDKYGLTPGCARCMSGASVHSGECRARILARLQQDETTRAAAAAVVVPRVGVGSSGDLVMSAPAAVPAAAAADEEMDPSSEPAEKRPRTVGALELEAFVERGLMYEGLDQQDHMELEVCALEDTAQDDLVSEIVVYDARSGEELDLNLVRIGRLRELDQMDKHQVYREVPSAQAWGRKVKAKWVDEARTKDGVTEVRSRLVAMEFNVFARDDVNASTPPLAVIRAIVSLAASKPGVRFLAVYDISVAFSMR